MEAYLRSGLICSMILLVVQQPLSSSLKLEELNETFKQNQELWLRKECGFPSPSDFTADKVTGAFVLKPCSSANELPTNLTVQDLGLQLCSMFFILSQTFCDRLEREHWKDALALKNEAWDVCALAKWITQFSFLTGDPKVCKRLCVEDEKMAPVCRLLVAAAYKVESEALKNTENAKTVEVSSNSPPPQGKTSTESDRPNATLSSQEANATLSPPQANATLSPPQANATLSPPQANATLSPPQANATLSSQDANATLSSQDANATLPSQDANATLPSQEANATLPSQEASIDPSPTKDGKKTGPSAESSGKKEMIPMEKKARSIPTFMAYFVVALVLVIAAYVIYHNRQKIMGYIMEDSQPEQHHRRHSPRGKKGDSKVKYSKLNQSAEEILPSHDRSITTRNYIY